MIQNQSDIAQQWVPPAPTLIEDAELALNNLGRQEISLIKDLEELFKKQVIYVKQIDGLREFTPNMDKIHTDIQRVKSMVDSSSILVEEVCSKFRKIDLAKARLEDCLSKIGDILDLNTCRDGTLKAMELNNYEEAAMHLKRYLSIDQNQLQRTITIVCGEETPQLFVSTKSRMNQPVVNSEVIFDQTPKSMREALKELDEARRKLLHLLQENMAKSIATKNTKDIERFFKIFPMLNEHLDGLHRYSQYLQSFMGLREGKEALSAADKLAALYEDVAKLISTHQPMIETFYGPGHIIVVIKALQRECDRLSRRVLEEFRNETNLQYVAKMVRSSSLQSISQSLTASSQSPNLNLSTSKLDPKTVDKILDEISLIVSRSEVYLSFIVQRIKDDIELKSEDEAQKKSSSLELYNLIYRECELNHLIQEVAGIYVMLEQFYLNESSKKAILMDQIDTDPSSPCLISSMLSDIFFIIKKCTKRAVSTKSNEVFCAIINHCVTLLESTFCLVLEDRLKNQAYYASATAKNLDFTQFYSAIQSGRLTQSTTDHKKSNAQYFSALNNLDKACDYLKKLRDLLNEDIKKLKPSMLVTEQNHRNELEKSTTCLNELSQLANRFMSIINSSLHQLFNTSLRNKIDTGLKTLRDENPELTSIITDSPDELSSLARHLLETTDNCLIENLLSNNYNRLVSITEKFLASTLKSIE